MIVSTLRKVKTILPSLKPPVDKAFKSNVVYQIMCPRCQSCYVGQTFRHMLTHFKEHIKEGKPVKQHFNDVNPSFDVMTIIDSSVKSGYKLMTLEALHIEALKPTINTRDEYKSRTLTIKI